MKVTQIGYLVSIVVALQGCATTSVDLGVYAQGKTLTEAINATTTQANKYMELADKHQDKQDDSYVRNFWISLIAAGGAISTMHASAVKGLAFASGSSALFADQAPAGKRGEALLAGAKTLQCMTEKVHLAGYGIPAGTPENKTAAAKAKLPVTVIDIQNRISAYSGFLSRAQGVEPQPPKASVVALATKIDDDLNPIASEPAIAAALNDGASFVERQIRQRFIDNAKFDYKKIFADLKALAETSAQKDDAAETEAAKQDLPAGAGKAARQTAKSDPRRTILKDLVVCRENLL